MSPDQLKRRTKDFALLIIEISYSSDLSLPARIIMNQLVRSACSVGANYRAACRARSKREFISKLSIVVEEADESQFWLELLAESEVEADTTRIRSATREALELVKIFAVSRRTAQSNR